MTQIEKFLLQTEGKPITTLQIKVCRLRNFPSVTNLVSNTDKTKMQVSLRPEFRLFSLIKLL
jgi:hypothetical protein